mmetsp:Transcript_44139/g.106907  ORF Transcript_44139/g.106907 Transcript_44139/m.106907 type:complete len:231 (-) Transcript_44139:223-915(-)|eukprot:CAMPEP_0113499746 /NCGR_PEP_ID=MMETSP0014_2-20120614/31922_1 /TAXON_ID=2857 /ORGANISM="Nitzschia sp." /LENGTH=230 /DNA_ID=CAMNT_0000393961 /DNA_START=519 /DNA_END=1211 /DNA_ORIENTATION=- /assembly_acc=CAM_ASM_000159
MELDGRFVCNTLVVMLFMAIGLHNRGRLQQQDRPRGGGGTWPQRVLGFISNIPGYLMTMASLAAFCLVTCLTLEDGRFSSDDDEILDTAMLIVCNMIALYLMPPWCYLICVVLSLAMAGHHSTHERNREAAAADRATYAVFLAGYFASIALILLYFAIGWCWEKMQQQWQQRQRRQQQQQQQQERMNRQRRPAPPPPAVPPPVAEAELLVLPEAFAEVDDGGEDDDDHDE